MKAIRVTTTLIMAGVLLAGSLFASGQPINQTELNVEAEASKLLKEVQLTARELSRDADRLDSYSRGGLSKESHGFQLTQVKNHINSMGQRLEMLQAMRDQMAPWQQDATNSVVPAAAKLAAHTEAAILHLNGSGKVLWHPEYTDHLRAISDRSDEVKEAIDLHLEMASTRDKLERLQDRASDIVN